MNNSNFLFFGYWLLYSYLGFFESWSYSYPFSLSPIIISYILLMFSSSTSRKWYLASKVALIRSHIFFIYLWVIPLNFINHCSTLFHNVVVNLMMKVTSSVIFHHIHSFSKMNKCSFVSWISFWKINNFVYASILCDHCFSHGWYWMLFWHHLFGWVDGTIDQWYRLEVLGWSLYRFTSK